MGRISIVKAAYRVEIKSRNPNVAHTPAIWRIREQGQIAGYGAPTNQNLLKYIRAFEASTNPGGCNAHLGPETIAAARIINQDTKAIVAQYGDQSKFGA